MIVCVSIQKRYSFWRKRRYDRRLWQYRDSRHVIAANDDRYHARAWYDELHAGWLDRFDVFFNYRSLHNHRAYRRKLPLRFHDEP